MALRFNPPPNWPTPPEGFIPQPGWRPDPAWGPAPEGWQFWVEETPVVPPVEDATHSLAPEETTAFAPAQAENTDATLPLTDLPAEPQAEAPVEAPAERPAEAPLEAPAPLHTPEPVEPQVAVPVEAPLAEAAPEVAPATSEQLEEAPQDPSFPASALEETPAPQDADATLPLTDLPAEAQADTQAPQGGYAPGPYQAQPQVMNQAQPAYPVSAPQDPAPAAGFPLTPGANTSAGSLAGTAAGAAAGALAAAAQGAQAQNPYTQQPAATPLAGQGNNQPPHFPGNGFGEGSGGDSGKSDKKNLKALWIALAALGVIFVLIITLVIFALTGTKKETENASGSTTSSVSQEAEESSSSSSQKSGESQSTESIDTSAGIKLPQGSDENFSYEGEGEKVIEIKKPDGEDSIAWVEFTYESKESYSTFSVQSETKDGKDGDRLLSIIGGDSESYKGSFWLDARWNHYEATTKFKVKGDGKWKFTIHSASKAPVYEAGSTFEGNVSEAFIVKESARWEASIAATETQRNAHFSLLVLPAVKGADSGYNLFSSDDSKLDATVKLPAGTYMYQMESWSGHGWKLDIEG